MYRPFISPQGFVSIISIINLWKQTKFIAFFASKNLSSKSFSHFIFTAAFGAYKLKNFFEWANELTHFACSPALCECLFNWNGATRLPHSKSKWLKAENVRSLMCRPIRKVIRIQFTTFIKICVYFYVCTKIIIFHGFLPFWPEFYPFRFHIFIFRIFKTFCNSGLTKKWWLRPNLYFSELIKFSSHFNFNLTEFLF